MHAQGGTVPCPFDDCLKKGTSFIKLSSSSISIAPSSFSVASTNTETHTTAAAPAFVREADTSTNTFPPRLPSPPRLPPPPPPSDQRQQQQQHPRRIIPQRIPSVEKEDVGDDDDDEEGDDVDEEEEDEDEDEDEEEEENDMQDFIVENYSDEQTHGESHRTHVRAFCRLFFVWHVISSF